MAGELQISTDTTGQTLYAVIRDPNGLAWDNTAGAFEAYDTASIGDYDLPMAEQGTASQTYIATFPAAIPASVLGAPYGVSVYDQAGGGPAEGDTLIGMGEIAWTPTVDVTSISGDTTAADALELQYDGTGLAGDTYPATQAQLSQIANVGSALNDPARSAPDGFAITFGENEVNDEDSTHALDGTYHTIEAQNDGGTEKIDVYYEFAIPGNGVPSEIEFKGRMFRVGASKNLAVYIWNWVTSSWRQEGTLTSSTSDLVATYRLFTAEVGTGANIGIVRIRFATGSVALAATSALYTDQIFVSYSIVARSVGYADGAIWYDSNASNTNTENYVDGVADNPVSTWAAVLTLSGQLNITRFRIHNGSTVTLTGNSDGYTLIGTNWSLDLNGQSIVEMAIDGAHLTGVGVAASGDVHLFGCLIGAATLPPAILSQCGIGEDSGTFTGGSAGEYVFVNCYSLVPGSGAPAFSFVGLGPLTGINNRGWLGGSTWTLDGDCTLSLEVVAGGDQTITTGGGDVEVRGICKTVTVTFSASERVAIVGIVGGVLLLGSATAATAALSGVSGPVVDTSTGVTVTDDTVNQENIGDVVWDEVLTGATHNDTNSAGRRLRQVQERGTYQGAIWVDAVNGTSGSEAYENGVDTNPVDNMADANTLAAALGISRFQIAPGSVITLTAATTNKMFFGSSWSLALGGQDIDGSTFFGASVTGVGINSAGMQYFYNCDINSITMPGGTHFIECRIFGNHTAGEAGDYFYDRCYSTFAGLGTPTFDFGVGNNASNLSVRHQSGGWTVENMGAGTGSYNMSLEGEGQIIIAASCSATSTIVIRGAFDRTDNSGGAVTIIETARYDVDQVAGAVWSAATRTLTSFGTLVADIWAGITTAALAKFASQDTGETTAVSGSVAQLAQGVTNVILGAVQATVQAGNRVSVPVALEMWQDEGKTFSLTIQDAAGDPVDLSSMTLRFVVANELDPPVGQFQVDEPTITVSGTSNEVANVPVSAVQAATANEHWRWWLWDTATDAVLSHGSFKIFPARDEVP